MDRNREARRGSMAAAAVNGSSGLSRRRQRRASNLRDSTDEDGGMEMHEASRDSRLRDRGVKKDRDRDRERSSSRSKRRRGDRLMHESSNRGEGDDSSDESMDEEDGDEDDEVGVRLPLQGNSSNFPPSTSSQQHSHNHHSQNQNHFRKSSCFLGSNTNNSKPVRPSAQLMKVSEEMIGVSIPRKARSSMKRPQEFSGTGEPIHHRQDSASPARHSPSSATSPSSNLPIRKKKSISGSKHRPPKMAKSPPVSSTIQEIEIAEVLFGMTRQAPLPVVDKQETNKVETKDDNPNGLNAEVKSRVSSPNSVSQTPSSQQQSVLPLKASAPKRKRPRLRLEEESPTSSVAATSAKIEAEMATKAEEVTSPRSKKNHEESGTVYIEIGSSDPSKDCVDNQKESAVKQESSNQVIESKEEEEAIKEKVGILGSKFVDKHDGKVVPSGADKSEVVKESPQKAKFSIDLMAPPSIMEKSTSDKDGLSEFSSDQKETGSEKKLLPFTDNDKFEKSSKNEGMSDHQNVGNFLSKGFDLKQQQPTKEKHPDLHLNLDKHDKEGLSLGCNGSKQQQQPPFSKQQQKSARVDHKQDKQAPTASMPLPVPIAGWPSGFPSFGYMGQVPPLQAVVPLDGSSLATNTIQPPNFIQPQQPLKRCATHCYIARNIHYQQFARMTNPFWAAAAAVGASGTPLYGTKYNLNAVPPSESTSAILGNPLQAGFPPVSLSTLQEKPTQKEMSSTNAAAVPNSNLYLDAASAHRKQFLLQQSSQPGPSATPPTMIPGPAIIFPINQQSAVTNQPGPTSKSTPGASGVTATSSPATTANSAAATSVSFNYAGMNPNDARCMAFMQSNAILQNNAYPFSMAAAAAAAAQAGSPTPYKGANPAQAMPFFNGSFYSPQMVPSQQQMQQHMLQQQQRQQIFHHQQQQQESSSAPRQPRNNSSTSSGSSSSQKHTQQTQQRVVPGSGIVAGVTNAHNFQTSLKQQPLNLMSRQARQLENEAAREGSPSSTGDNIRLSQQAQKTMYGQSFAMPKMSSQNFALISPATAATAMPSNGANRNDKQQQQNQQHTLKELSPQQVFAMSFASFGGPATAGGPSFDFSNIVQNPALLQNMPEVAARHGYQISVAAQQKKIQQEDAKSVGDSGTSDKGPATNEAKIATNANKQQSLNFSRPDNDHAMTNIITNLADASTRPSAVASRAINPPSYTTAPTTGAAAATANPSGFNMSPKSQQQCYQHVFEVQRQQQRLFLQQQQQQKLPSSSSRQNVKPGSSPMPAPNNSSSSVNNATSVSSSMAPSRFPPLSVLQQGGANSNVSHSPQWKSSAPNNNRQQQSMTAIAAASSNSSSAKNQMLQQQQQLQQTQQISFGGVGLSSNKPVTNQSATPMNIGSPQSSISKSSAAAAAGTGSSSSSPRAAAAAAASSDSKALPSPSIQHPHQQQMIAAAAAAKHSQTAAASSNLKPSSPITATNRNLNSMLGHPQMASSASNNSSSSKNSKIHQQQQKQQQMQKQQQQSFQPPQIFFNSSPYIHQAQQSNQSSAKNSTASGMLSLSSSMILAGGSPAAGSDPSKASAAASNNKGATSAQQQQQQHQAAQYAAATAAASMASHPFMPSYPYMHAMQASSVSNKTASTTAADKKQQQSTTGQGENVHASWKPEKR